jgi:Holliday junction resolvase
MKESDIQKKIIKKLEQDGYFVIKIIMCNKNGAPDLIASKADHTMYIEVKRPKGVLSEIQLYRILEMQNKGLDVRVWIDYMVNYE